MMNWYRLKGPEGTIIGISVVSEEMALERKRAGAVLRESKCRHWEKLMSQETQELLKSAMSGQMC